MAECEVTALAISLMVSTILNVILIAAALVEKAPSAQQDIAVPLVEQEPPATELVEQSSA